MAETLRGGSGAAPTMPLGDRKFGGLAVVEEMAPRGMLMVRGDFADPSVAGAVSAATGAEMPDRLGVTRGDGGIACWMSPDELLLILPHDMRETAIERLVEALAGGHHLVADVSDMRALFRVSGARARDTLAKLVPLDLSSGAFGTGTFRRTRLAQVAAAVWMDDRPDGGSFGVMVMRSHAEYAFGVLRAAAEHGEVDFHR